VDRLRRGPGGGDDRLRTRRRRTQDRRQQDALLIDAVVRQHDLDRSVRSDMSLKMPAVTSAGF
jgi:hypothetical protein